MKKLGIIVLLMLVSFFRGYSQHYNLFSSAVSTFHFQDALLKQSLDKCIQANKPDEYSYLLTDAPQRPIAKSDQVQAEILNILIAFVKNDSKKAIKQVIFLNESIKNDSVASLYTSQFYFSKYVVFTHFRLYINEADFLSETDQISPELKYILYSQVFYHCDKLLKKLPVKIFGSYINESSRISAFDMLKACSYVISSDCGVNTEKIIATRDSLLQVMQGNTRLSTKLNAAIQYSFEPTETEIKRQLSYEKIISFNDKGTISRKKSDLKGSLGIMRNAIGLLSQMPPFRLSAEIFMNAGISASLVNLFDEASGYYQKAIATAESFSRFETVARAKIMLARNSFNAGKNQLALSDALASLNYCRDKQDLKNMSEAYLLLSEIYTDESDYLEAGKAYREHINMNKMWEDNKLRSEAEAREKESRFEEIALEAFNEFQETEAKKAENLKIKLETARRDKDILELKRITELNAAKLAYSQLEKEKSAQNIALIEEKLRLKKKEIAALENENRLNAMESSYKQKQLELVRNKNFLFLQKQLLNEIRVDIIRKNQRMLKWGISILGVLLALLVFFLFYGYGQRRKIQQQNVNLSRKNNEIEMQKNIIQEKNKEIIDSINYALKIQTALLPTEAALTNILGDIFVFYQPKDIVSGDFYWCFENEKYKFYATADCTGHGVPGGFMSMMGMSLLNEIVKEKKLEEPADILDLLSAKIVSELKQTDESNVNKDGIDITLCRITQDKKELCVASAYNDLWLLRKNEIIEIKADRHSVGYNYGAFRQFTQHTIALQKKDRIYTLSDGYPDQFGGEKLKKFKNKNLKNLLLAIYNLPAAEQHRLVKLTFDNWKGKEEQVDDVLLMGLLL